MLGAGWPLLRAWARRIESRPLEPALETRPRQLEDAVEQMTALEERVNDLERRFDYAEGRLQPAEPPRSVGATQRIPRSRDTVIPRQGIGGGDCTAIEPAGSNQGQERRRWVVRRAIVLLATGLVTACAPRIDVEAARQAIMDADIAFAQATAERGAEGWASFAEDGQQYPSRGVVVGRDSIRRFMTPVFADATQRLTWKPTAVTMVASADLGYTLGR